MIPRAPEVAYPTSFVKKPMLDGRINVCTEPDDAISKLSEAVDVANV